MVEKYWGDFYWGNSKDFYWGNSYWGDNIPADIPPPEDVVVIHYCPECGFDWKVVMSKEMGRYHYYDEDNDPYCPGCGCEGTI